MRFGSLFSGIGGLDLGLERAGHECAWQVEIDEYASRVLAKHWPDVPRFRDVRECGAHNLEPVDLIAGGFPCQDVSGANQKGAGLEGKRSGLWGEFLRIIHELRPRYVLVENVANLLNRGIGRVLGDLASCGYDAEWDVLSAADLGAPHLRERVFIVAYPSSVRLSKSPELLRFHAPKSFMQHGGTWNGRRVDQPDIERVVNGVPNGMDRLRGLGNAVVPQVAQWIGERLNEHARPLS